MPWWLTLIVLLSSRGLLECPLTIGCSGHHFGTTALMDGGGDRIRPSINFLYSTYPSTHLCLNGLALHWSDTYGRCFLANPLRTWHNEDHHVHLQMHQLSTFVVITTTSSCVAVKILDFSNHLTFSRESRSMPLSSLIAIITQNSLEIILLMLNYILCALQ